MLLTRDELLSRLCDRLTKSDRVDVAVAWASDCDALEQLLQFGRRHGACLRTVVGIQGNSTHPNALRELKVAGQLRIDPSSRRLFHPKLYLFHQAQRRIGWVGSANLTRAGFQQNEELVLEFDDSDQNSAQWFERIWSSLDNDCTNIIMNYTKQWQKSPPHTYVAPTIIDNRVISHDVYALGRDLTDWASFVKSIEVADRCWSTISDNSVVGEHSSWLDTITLGRAVVRRSSWAELGNEDRRLILGRGLRNKKSDGYELLGDMRGAGRVNHVFLKYTPETINIRKTIRQSLQVVLDSNDKTFADAACAFIRDVSDIAGFSGGIATRILALARPDRGISVNNGSKDHLAKLTGLPPSSLSASPRNKAHSYRDLLRWFEDKDWYQNPTPGNAYERLLASVRAALIDPFVYEHPPARQ